MTGGQWSTAWRSICSGATSATCASSLKHTPEQRREHAECALDALEAVETPAERDAIDVTMIFTSFDPDLLLELSRALTETGRTDSALVHLGFGALFGIPAPLDSQSQPVGSFSDEIGVELVSAHPQWFSQVGRQAAESRDWELGYWMFSSVPVSYAAIARDQPRYITTSEAGVVSRWLGR